MKEQSDESYLKFLKNKQKKIVCSEYFDYVNLTDWQYTVLELIGNAKSLRELMNLPFEKYLDIIQEKIKKCKNK